jgi:transcriptional activator SPT8
MAHADSDEEQEPFEDAEEDNEDDVEDEENLDAVEEATTQGEDVCIRLSFLRFLFLIFLFFSRFLKDSPSEDSEDGSDDAEDADSEPAIEITGDLLNEAFAQVEASAAAAEPDSPSSRSTESSKDEQRKSSFFHKFQRKFDLFVAISSFSCSTSASS